jgi:transposase-like protein
MAENNISSAYGNNLAESPSHKKQRRRYDNNLKAQLLDELIVRGTKKYGIPASTLRDWTKVSVIQSIEVARQKHECTLKVNMYDPLRRLAESLAVFIERKNQSEEHLKLAVSTNKLIARNNLTDLNELQPFLESKENKRALASFTG